MRVRSTSVAILIAAAAAMAATPASSQSADAVPLTVHRSTTSQDTEVKSARVSLVPKANTVLKVTIENLRDSPLVEVQIGLQQPRGGKSTSTWYFGAGRTNEPVQPHERRTVETRLTDDEVGTAALELVVFEDGYYRGVTGTLERWRQARQERIDDLRYWSGVFDVMPRVSETDLRAYLASRLADRQDLENPSAMRVTERLLDVLRRYPSGPDVWSGLDRLRAETKLELAALTRQPSGNAPPAAGPMTAAAIVTQERAASTTLVTAIENLRDVPIEAFKVEIVDPGTNHMTSGLGSDFCVVEPGPTDRQRIQPREIREVPLNVKPDDQVPLVRLAAVIFDDLFVEGRRDARDELFLRREKTAEDYAFAIAALNQAAARPVAELHAFLVEKRAERAKQLQAEGRPRDTQLTEMDELIRQAKDSPDRLLANVKTRQERLEHVRKRLVRHLGG